MKFSYNVFENYRMHTVNNGVELDFLLIDLMADGVDLAKVTIKVQVEKPTGEKK